MNYSRIADQVRPWACYLLYIYKEKLSLSKEIKEQMRAGRNGHQLNQHLKKENGNRNQNA